LNEVGKNFDVLNAAKDVAIKQVQAIPVLGPLAKEVLDQLK
jgi:hypothetical protein